jgi:hypothetical protein
MVAYTVTCQVAENIGTDGLWSFMFPIPQNSPATVSQGGVGAPVSHNIGGELRIPPVGIVLRVGSVHRTPVPEASVDEDHNLPLFPDNISPDLEVRLGSYVDPESYAGCMQRLPYCDLRPGVHATLDLHPPSYDRRRRRCWTWSSHVDICLM